MMAGMYFKNVPPSEINFGFRVLSSNKRRKGVVVGKQNNLSYPDDPLILVVWEGDSPTLRQYDASMPIAHGKLSEFTHVLVDPNYSP